jgi:hypothetical protein
MGGICDKDATNFLREPKTHGKRANGLIVWNQPKLLHNFLVTPFNHLI